jgi:glyoxylase-like metal-dependent hydrolase (beta-lactamase superfamily II)
MQTTPFLSPQGVISFLITNSSNQAIVIDPSYQMAQDIVLYIKQKGLKLLHILETHTHADFFSSRALFKTLYPQANIGLSQFAPTKDNELKLKDGDILKLHDIKIKVWHTHGHTNDSLVFVMQHEGQTSIFSGDTLLIEGTGRTDFQLGESESLYASLEQILTLPDNTIIYPGHNYRGQTKTVLAVEKITNKRLKLVLENKKKEFLILMKSHVPPKPDLFEESLRWNAK